VPSGLSSMTPGLSGWLWAYIVRKSSAIAPAPLQHGQKRGGPHPPLKGQCTEP
jgi:hypothetical protein